MFAIAPNAIKIGAHLDLKSISEKLELSLKEEIADVYKYLTGKDSSCDTESLNSEVDKFLLETKLLNQLDREISSVKNSIHKVH